jgi:UDP-glucose:(glucosyl)LPS alpha-1,2-glucosyltransferase
MTNLIITGDPGPEDDGSFSLGGPTAVVSADGTYEGAKGGTEMMRDRMFEMVDNDLTDQFNFILSRVTEVPTDKPTLLWLHDMWDDPQVGHLAKEESRKRFGKLIFVSNWQQWTYAQGMNIPFHEGIVMKNAIDPIIVDKKKKDDVIRLIYHTTPHRGLDILVAGFSQLVTHFNEIDGPEIHLDVYSSFEIYNWKDADDDFKDLFDACRDHPNITYHGYQPNATVREALKEAHIYGYPNTWPETSCISALEAMSAGCAIVCPNFAALPETCANWATMYNWNENKHAHAQIFVNILKSMVMSYWNDDHQLKLKHAQNYVNNFYNWEFRAMEWEGLLRGMIESMRAGPDEEPGKLQIIQ